MRIEDAEAAARSIDPAPIRVESRPTGELGGWALAVQFDNGYEASVICHQYSYGGPAGLAELAVIDSDTGKLVYDTPVTEDVVGHLNLAELTEVLASVAALDKEAVKRRNAAPPDEEYTRAAKLAVDWVFARYGTEVADLLSEHLVESAQQD